MSRRNWRAPHEYSWNNSVSETTAKSDPCPTHALDGSTVGSEDWTDWQRDFLVLVLNNVVDAEPSGEEGGIRLPACLVDVDATSVHAAPVHLAHSGDEVVLKLRDLLLQSDAVWGCGNALRSGLVGMALDRGSGHGETVDAEVTLAVI